MGRRPGQWGSRCSHGRGQSSQGQQGLSLFPRRLHFWSTGGRAGDSISCTPAGTAPRTPPCRIHQGRPPPGQLTPPLSRCVFPCISPLHPPCCPGAQRGTIQYGVGCQVWCRQITNGCTPEGEGRGRRASSCRCARFAQFQGQAYGSALLQASVSTHMVHVGILRAYTKHI
jgi:hypothetical protein